MPRTAAKQRTVRITISTSETVHKYLKALIPLGLYGGSVAEVAERLICGALQNDLRKRKAILLDPEQEKSE
jgi:hypothetical protein